MIEYLIFQEGRALKGVVYNEWDVSPSQLIDPFRCYTIDNKHIGKFVQFNDGSGFYAKIQEGLIQYIKTSCGMMKHKDYLRISLLKPMHTNYSGLPKSKENFIAKPLCEAEKDRIKSFIKGEKIGLTRREKVAVIDEIKRKLEEKGITTDWAMNNIVDECTNNKNRGFERLEANKIILRVLGVEVEPKNVQQAPPQALFAQFNSINIQDQRRSDAALPDTPMLKKIVDMSGGGILSEFGEEPEVLEMEDV